jgi:hypothetical protein
MGLEGFAEECCRELARSPYRLPDLEQMNLVFLASELSDPTCIHISSPQGWVRPWHRPDRDDTIIFLKKAYVIEI